MWCVCRVCVVCVCVSWVCVCVVGVCVSWVCVCVVVMQTHPESNSKKGGYFLSELFFTVCVGIILPILHIILVSDKIN